MLLARAVVIAVRVGVSARVVAGVGGYGDVAMLVVVFVVGVVVAAVVVGDGGVAAAVVAVAVVQS